MFSQILTLFPPNTHFLTLVSDPDRLLANETLTNELFNRGFQVIQEDDPVFLHHRMEETKPFTIEYPVIITTTRALESLPYDLFQPAHKIRLSLHQFFPNLSYPIMLTLRSDQIEILTTKEPPRKTLSQKKTIDYLLEEVFEADLSSLSHPHGLIVWLNEYHHRQSPLPELLRTDLVESLKRLPVYKDWDIDRLVCRIEDFNDFIQERWKESIDYVLTGNQIKENASEYHVTFESNPQLQDLVPGLVRRGSIKPLEIADKDVLPTWALAGISIIDARISRSETLLEDLRDRINSISDNSIGQESWSFWQGFSLDWAELVGYRAQTDLAFDQKQEAGFEKLVHDVDANFCRWLKNNYTALGANRLPNPKHVQHVPHYLQYLRNFGQAEKIVLLVMDGLSLTDWQLIKSIWSKRHPSWKTKNDILLAQVPTITSISRYSLVSGLLPKEFIVGHTPRISESRAWELFWSRANIPGKACNYLALSYDRQIDQGPDLEDPRIKFWCLIDDTTDKLAHNATLGAADQLSSLRLWLDPTHDQNSLPLEKMIDSFLDRSFSVFIASDHGHVEATGFGFPSEGLLAQTRGKRARIYQDKLAALQIQSTFSNTHLWNNDSILPEHWATLMPIEREAFAAKGEVVVTHGGISIEEIVVPFIQISKESA